MRLMFDKADKDLFAIYHTLYTPDIEMWFDFNRRLKDTSWCDNGYFVICDGRIAGGALIGENCISHAFLVPPFNDRVGFWRFLLAVAPVNEVRGALEPDARVLEMFGFRATRIGQVMCRPADMMDVKLDEAFYCRPLDPEESLDGIAKVIHESYAGGICNEINGAATLEETIADCNDVRKIYDACYRANLIVEKSSGRIAAVCVAGHGQQYVNAYNEIADLCVLPEFRGRELARYLVAKAVSEARGHEPYVKLFVYIGNNAEYLYHTMGFVGGPRFTNMRRQASHMF